MTIRSIQLDACELSFLGDGVVHACFNAGRIVEKAELKAMYEKIFAERNGLRSLFLVSVGDDVTTISNEGRAYASSEEVSKFIVADAIIVKDFKRQLSANAFIRHNKPARPIRTFENKDKAVNWLKSQKHLLDE